MVPAVSWTYTMQGNPGRHRSWTPDSLRIRPEDYPGRGPIEAFGDGMELIGGDIAFRCNFATVDNQGLISDRRADGFASAPMSLLLL